MQDLQICGRTVFHYCFVNAVEILSSWTVLGSLHAATGYQANKHLQRLHDTSACPAPVKSDSTATLPSAMQERDRALSTELQHTQL